MSTLISITVAVWPRKRVLEFQVNGKRSEVRACYPVPPIAPVFTIVVAGASAARWASQSTII